MTTPELSRPVSADRPPAVFEVEANAEERAALARRLGIPGVEALRCRFALRPQGRAVVGHGDLEADVVQACVVTLEPVPQAVRERFTVRFVPAGEEADDDDPDAPDELPFDGARIDLGEATAEQLALALDPYPRSTDADFEGPADPQADVAAMPERPETPASPFKALDRLPRRR